MGQFLAWCAARGLGLTAVSPLHVAAYIRTHPGSAPTVKQHLAAIRMLGDWLVVSQVLPVNPAAAVRGPKHVVTTGRTLSRRLVLAMIKRRAAAADLPPSTCCHTFRATGITAYLSNGGTLEHAQPDRRARLPEDHEALRPDGRTRSPSPRAEGSFDPPTSPG